MRNITLHKLRTLAAAVADAEQDSKGWDKATDALSAKFSPRCLVNLIDQLEEGLCERDEAIQQKNESGERFYNAVQYGTKLEAELKRRNAQEPGLSLEAHSTIMGMIEHCLEHRICMGMDEGFMSFDPEVEHDFVKDIRAFIKQNSAAAPAAVLPIDIVITAEVAKVGGLILKGCESEYQDDAARRVFNAMLAAATAPGGGDV